MFMENVPTFWAYEAQWIHNDEANKSTLSFFILGFILRSQGSDGT